MNRVFSGFVVALAVSPVLAGCSAEPSPAEPSNPGHSEPTLEELREDAKSVVRAIYPLAPGPRPLSDLLAATDEISPAPCEEENTWRLTPVFRGGGTDDPQAFVDTAERALAEVGLPSTPSRRNGVVGDQAYVSAKHDDGRLIAITASSERMLVQYQTTCSPDESLLDAVKEAADEGHRPSNWQAP